MAIRNVLLAAAVLCAAATPVRAQETWVDRADMPESTALAGAALFPGELYVFGGANPDTWVTSSTTRRYDLATNTWSFRASMPAPRCAMVTAVVDGRVYLVGGADDTQELASVVVYDPATDSWSSRAPMSTPRFGSAGGAVGGRIVVAGGTYSYYASTEIYDPATDSWSAGSPMPQGLLCPYSAVVGGKLLVAGGFSDTVLGDALSNVSSATHEYDPATDAWTRRADMPEGVMYGLWAGASASLDGKFYCLGGEIILLEGEFSANLEYDPATDAWSNRLAEPHWTAFNCAVGGLGRIFVVGGSYAGDGVRLQEYRPRPLPPPSAPADLVQRRATGATIDEGQPLTPQALRLGATLESAAAVKLEIELRKVAQDFLGVATHVGVLSPEGALEVEVPSPGVGSWKWRARGVNEEGASSAWVEFGTVEGAADFVLAFPPVPPPPTGSSSSGDDGGKGCGGSATGATGALAGIWVLILAAAGSVRRA